MDIPVSDAAFWAGLLEIVMIDLLLSGDNAMVIALASRSLPPNQARIALIGGTGAAILLRIILTGLAALVMNISGLKVLGGIALLIIAVKLLLGEEEGGPECDRSGKTLWSAIIMIVIADAAMSLDNVIAVAAASHGNLFLLSFGLILSIPLLMAGSVLIGRLFQAFPLLVAAGGALLGWIAGAIMVADPLIAGWLRQNVDPLPDAAPPVAAVVVLLSAWYLRRRRRLVDAA